MSLRGDDHSAAYEWLKAAEAGEIAKGGPAGWQGTTYNGGPYWVDFNRTRRAPFLPELVEAIKGVAFSCMRLNMNAVARQKLHLYVTTGAAQQKPKYFATKSVDKIRQRQIRKSAWFADRIKAADEIDEVDDHQLLEVIRWVNPDFNRNKLIRHAVMCLDGVGQAFWWMEAGQVGELKGIWPLLAQYMWPVRFPESSIVNHYQYFDQIYYPQDLVRMAHVSPRDPYALGYAPLQAAFAYAGLADQYISLQENLMTQGGRPSLLISNKEAAEPLGRVERERYEREFNYKMSRGNQGLSMFIDGAIDVKTLTFPPTDLAALKVSEASLEEVARCFGVPLSLLRDSEGNRAVADAGHYQHALLAVDPLCEIIATALTDWMHGHARKIERAAKARGEKLGSLDWSRLFWAFDSPVTQDKEVQAKVFQMLAENFEPNEIRAEFGYEPRPWGDEPLWANTKTQPSTAEEQRDIANRRADELARKPKPAKDEEPGVSDGEPAKKPARDETEDDDDGEASGSRGKALEPPTTAVDTSDIPTPEALLGDVLERLGLAEAYHGDYLTSDERNMILHELRVVGRAWLRDEAERALAEIEAADEAKGLVGAAKDAASRFFGRAKSFVKTLLVAGGLAFGGPGELSDAEARAIDANHAAQVQYLDQFQREVQSGAKTLDPGRAEMYGASVWPSSQNLAIPRAKRLDHPFGRRVHHGADQPCPPCAAQVARGWLPIDEVGPLGDCEGLTNCHCSIETAEEIP